MLRTLTEEQKANWKTSVPKIVHAHSSTCSEVTGFSLISSCWANHPGSPSTSCSTWVSATNKKGIRTKWQNRMREAYSIACHTATEETSRGKVQYDKEIYGNELQPREFWSETCQSQEDLANSDCIDVVSGCSFPSISTMEITGGE